MALSKALNTDMSSVAKMLQSLGRGKDTILAHITPEEARLLKARGGRGSINPATGLPEFEAESVTVSSPSADYGTFMYEPSFSSFAPPPAPAPVSTDMGEQVKVTGTRTPTTDAGTFMYDPGIIQAPTPQPLSIPTAAAPAAAAAAAPAAATVVPGTEQAVVTGQRAPALPVDYSYLDEPSSKDQPPPASGPSLNQRAKSFLGNNSTLLSILGLGGMGLLGGINLSKGAGQGAALQNNLAALAQPTQALGNATLATTMAGGLTPQNAQVLQATEAQIASSQARGAVSAAQAAEAISQTYAGLLQNQLTTAISLLNTADSYLQNAYIQGYNANVANQTQTQNFYSTLGQLAMRMGGIAGSPGTTITLPAGSSVS